MTKRVELLIAERFPKPADPGAATIPLPEIVEERRMTSDPRRSIIERYPNAEAYVAAITAASRQLVEEGLMPEEDVERAAAAAADFGADRAMTSS
jgi:hypothetical protein